jgi:hypothetical protein
MAVSDRAIGTSQGDGMFGVHPMMAVVMPWVAQNLNKTCLLLGIRELKRLIVEGHRYLEKKGAGADVVRFSSRGGPGGGGRVKYPVEL